MKLESYKKADEILRLIRQQKDNLEKYNKALKGLYLSNPSAKTYISVVTPSDCTLRIEVKSDLYCKRVLNDLLSDANQEIELLENEFESL